MCSSTQLQVVTAVADWEVVAASARPSGRSRRNLCRAHSRLSHSRCLHIFRCSRYHSRLGMCSRTRTILLQETAAAVATEAVEAVEAVETVEAAKCTGDHSRCSRCQEDIGSSWWSETRSLALRLHRCQHRMNGRRYKKSMNSSLNCMCSGTKIQAVAAGADWEVDMAGAADRRGAVRSRCNRFRAG